MDFKDRLIELRKESRLSQEELGYKLGVTRQTVSKWETGQTTPEMNKLFELSKMFSISVDDLIGNNKPYKNKNTNIYCYNTSRYEYKSKKTFLGIPVIHINVGRGLYSAKGIIAIGTIARGVISVGIFSLGLISIGSLSLGLLMSMGGFSIGSISIGGVSIGVLALGGISVGILSIGGLSLGKYAIGGVASATDIAIGGYARGHIAIGDTAKGEYVWENMSQLSNYDRKEIRETILREYPKIWRWILELFSL